MHAFSLASHILTTQNQRLNIVNKQNETAQIYVNYLNMSPTYYHKVI